MLLSKHNIAAFEACSQLFWFHRVAKNVFRITPYQKARALPYILLLETGSFLVNQS